VVHHADEPAVMGVWGVQVRVLLDGRQSGGQYSIVDYLALPGAPGPALHYHRQMEESFHIMQGQMQFQIGEKRIAATTGMFVHVPAGVPHAFWNATKEPARMTVTFGP